MGLKLLDPPAKEPVTLAEARLDRRLGALDTTFDSLLSALIATARFSAEATLGRALIKQQWLMTLDEFPSHGSVFSAFAGPTSVAGFMIIGGGVARLTTGSRIELPFAPLISLDSISYVDQTGAEQVMDPNDYLVSVAEEPALVEPAWQKDWPQTRAQMEAVRVRFTCGYGEEPTDVPMGIKRWMLLRIGAMFENREEIVVDRRITQINLEFADGLLDPFQYKTITT